MLGRVVLQTIVVSIACASLGCDRAVVVEPAAPRQPPNVPLWSDVATTPDDLDSSTSTHPVRRCRFRDVADQHGVTFSYHNGAQGKLHLWETMGGGVGVIDYDGDGWMDLYFTNGCDDPYAPPDERYRGRLFRNLGGGQFVEATEQSMLTDLGYGQGCAVGDYDNDGFDELFVTRYGSAALFRNNGDGTVREITAQAGMRCPLWNTACAFADLSGRGALDLFVTGYLEIDLETEPTCRDRRGKLAYCGPDNYEGQPFQLFENLGDGGFVDISQESGVVVPNSKGLAVAAWDVDDDGRLDVFVVNDAEPGRLFRKTDASGPFEDIALTAGVAYTGDGHVYSGMGIASGDYDGDGRIDLAVSNFFEKGVVLFQSRGAGSFRDRSIRAGVGPATRTRTGFGLAFLDADNDTWPDLFVANGHISDLRADGIPYGMKAQLFYNRQGGGFLDISDQAGEYFESERLGRGLAVADLDNDGGSDLVVSHNVGPVSVLRNETPDRGHFLRVTLVGSSSSRSPYGAWLTATVGGRNLVHCLVGGGSYLSASDQRIVLGLGSAAKVDTIEVLWPSGRRDRWVNVPADQEVRLYEGRERHRTIGSSGVAGLTR